MVVKWFVSICFLMCTLLSSELLPEEPDHLLFLRYAKSPVVEANWTITKGRRPHTKNGIV